MPSIKAQITTVASQATDVVLVPANLTRSGLTIHNDDANALHVLFGGGVASTTNFSVIVAPAGQLVVAPFDWQGPIRGCWAADGAGSARVTEFC